MSFNFNRLTVKAQEIVQTAIEIAQNYNNQVVEPEHILAAVVQERGNIAETIIKKTGGNFNAVKIKVNQLLESLPKVSGTGLGNQQMGQNLSKLFDTAAEETRNLKDDYVSTEHILLALSNDKGKAGQLLRLVGQPNLLQKRHCPFPALSGRVFIGEIHGQHHVLPER